MDDEHEDDTATEHGEELPFALIAQPTEGAKATEICTPQTHVSRQPFSSSYLSNNGNTGAVPGLASSVVSSPTDGESQASTSSEAVDYASRSFLHSQYLDTAASLLLPDSSTTLAESSLSQTQVLPGSRGRSSSSSTSRTPLPTSQENSVDFSQLLQEADDANPVTPVRPRRLPVLPEEQSVASATTNSAATSSSFYFLSQSARGPPSSPTTRESQSQNLLSNTIVAAAPGGSGSMMGDERRLASLAGATASLTGDYSFEVSVDVTATVTDVMDVVGNPDLLRLWCDPVSNSLVITSSSEGARNAANLRSREEGREYEGEWIEATTSRLIPPTNTSCLYSTSAALSRTLGFPSYGKIAMFVERQRGQVSLTLGRFAGGMEVSHRLTVSQLSSGGNKVRVVDDARVRKADSEASCCGMLEWLETCLLPTAEDYMDQVLSSMARLRFLVENGEASFVTGRNGEPHTMPLLH